MKTSHLVWNLSHEIENASQPFQKKKKKLDSLFYIPEKEKQELENIVMKSSESSTLCSIFQAWQKLFNGPSKVVQR